MRKRLSMLLLSALMISGCATASISTKSIDGKTTECQAQYFSVFKEMDTASMSACGGKGGASGSKINAAMAEILFKALLTAP